nr:methyltransferase domain-containing protein [Candidatus Freyarchaeota archaeon]
MKVNYNSRYAGKYDQIWDLPESLFQPQLRLVLQKLEIKHKPRILDVGCGAGHHTLFLENSFDGETIGLDTSIGMLKQIQKKGAEIKLLRACGENIPLMNNVVNLVFISYVLHQSEEKEKLISEAYRVLKRNGHTAILTSSHNQLRSDLVHQYFPRILEINLKRFPPLDEIKEMLNRAGFKNVSFSEISVKQEASAEEIIERIKGKPMSVFNLLSEEEFQSGLRSFIKNLRSKYKDKLTYKDSSSLITANKLA